MALRIFARALFALGIIGIGILTLVFKAYALQWQPVPSWVPQPFVFVSAAILIASGAGLLINRADFAAGAVLTAFLAIWVIALQLPLAIASYTHVGAWLPLAEDIALMCGAWTLMATPRHGQGTPSIPFVSDLAGLRTARLLFGVACLVFGAAHFAYADFTAQMVPEWLPQRLWWAWATGAGHLATGAALLLNVLPRLAAAVEGVMMSAFVLLVHIPMVIKPAADGVQLAWTMLFVASALSASAFAIAGTLSDLPWVGRKSS